MGSEWSGQARKAGRGSRMQSILGGIVAVLLGAVPVQPICAAQATAPENSPNKIEDAWQGTLHVPQHDLRIVMKASRGDKGELKVLNYSIDQGGTPMTADSASFEDKTLKFTIDMIDGKYEGKMSADGKSIDGTWTQGPNALPLLFERATPGTAWAIPEPPPRTPPMPADADPSFEVATIKPSKPDQPGKVFLVRPGGEFTTVNTTVADMLKFAYGIHDKQVIGGPDWINSTKFDITAKPDIAGAPSEKQLKGMMQKLLADRLQLKFHRDHRELSAYVLSVAKTGQKMKQDTGDPNGLPALFFQGLGNLMVRNATMMEFTGLMQSTVLDRPVVDQTGLDGRWDFRLKWTPDESQFGGMGIKVPPPSDAADAPPPLFTAVQEELGLKLEATKTAVEVLVLDHIEQPSAN